MNGKIDRYLKGYKIDRWMLVWLSCMNTIYKTLLS